MAKNLPSQNRDAPAYQEFAASMMARREYRQLSLAERGLLYTLRLELWVNRSVPSDDVQLARMLGYDRAEIETLMPNLSPFFDVRGADLICPELENYRTYQAARHERMAEGARQTNEKKRKEKAVSPPVTPPVTLGVTPPATPLRQDKTRQDQSKQVRHKGGSSSEWVADYESCSPDDYAKASRG